MCSPHILDGVEGLEPITPEQPKANICIEKCFNCGGAGKRGLFGPVGLGVLAFDCTVCHGIGGAVCQGMGGTMATSNAVLMADGHWWYDGDITSSAQPGCTAMGTAERLKAITPEQAESSVVVQLKHETQGGAAWHPSTASVYAENHRMRTFVIAVCCFNGVIVMVAAILIMPNISDA